MDDADDISEDTRVTRDNLQAVAESFYKYLIDSVLLNPVFKIHRVAKLTGSAAIFRLSGESARTSGEADIFADPRVLTRQPKSMEVLCDECNRSIAASRFAPHLEKCMGMGRNSSRVARRRLANYVSLKGSSSTGRLRDSVGRDSDPDHSDDDSRHTLPDDDEDWTSSRRAKKSKRAKSRPKPKTTRQRLALEKMDIDEDSVGSFESAYDFRK